MAILARRRLQSILDHLASTADLSPAKRKDIVNRLNDEDDPKQSLGAEYELVVFWMLRECAQFEIEPEWCAGPSQPDAYCESLFLDGRGELCEVTAIGNGRAKEEEDMRAVSRQFVQAANRIERGVGSYLHFTYGEEWEHLGSRQVRVRQIPRNLKITPYIERGLRILIEMAGPRPMVRLKEGKLDVLIQRKTEKQHHLFNFHSSVPPEAKTLTDNPIYDALKKKRDQLKGASAQSRKVIWLCDAGADLLRDCGKPRIGSRGITAEEIIQNFLFRYPEIDLVCVLSPQHTEHTLGHKIDHWWQLTPIAKEKVKDLVNQRFLNAILEKLPKPRFAGYQARHLVLQGAYAPNKQGWYEGVVYRSNKSDGSVEVSARLIIDLLAGRITPEQFSKNMGNRDGVNIFARILSSGVTFNNIEFQSGGEDKDDDKVILYYSKDAGAARYE